MICTKFFYFQMVSKEKVKRKVNHFSMTTIVKVAYMSVQKKNIYIIPSKIQETSLLNFLTLLKENLNQILFLTSCSKYLHWKVETSFVVIWIVYFHDRKTSTKNFNNFLKFQFHTSFLSTHFKANEKIWEPQ